MVRRQQRDRFQPQRLLWRVSLFSATHNNQSHGEVLTTRHGKGEETVRTNERTKEEKQVLTLFLSFVLPDESRLLEAALSPPFSLFLLDDDLDLLLLLLRSLSATEAGPFCSMVTISWNSFRRAISTAYSPCYVYTTTIAMCVCGWATH